MKNASKTDPSSDVSTPGPPCDKITVERPDTGCGSRGRSGMDAALVSGSGPSGRVREPVLEYIAPPLRPLALPLDSLRPPARNPRLHSDRDIPVLMESLRRFGQRKPIVARRVTREIIAGNGTAAAARLLKWTHIAVVLCDDSDAEATAFALVDNQSALLSSWDLEVLGSQLGELRDLDVDLPAALGWSHADLTALLHVGEFQPATEGEQGRLDQVEPITCPRCGHEFHR